MDCNFIFLEHCLQSFDLQLCGLTLKLDQNTQIFRCLGCLTSLKVTENKWVNSHSGHTEISACSSNPNPPIHPLKKKKVKWWRVPRMVKTWKRHQSPAEHIIPVLIFHIRLLETRWEETRGWPSTHPVWHTSCISCAPNSQQLSRP